ncbi:hypothetical protein FOZ63_033384 [Perkinsus olseni]|uniref:Uncharacterized protein n=1 Tax=Perkinsus olseni TaxID=32597 RepID=A0A7J6SSY4_PEROL
MDEDHPLFDSPPDPEEARARLKARLTTFKPLRPTGAPRLRSVPKRKSSTKEAASVVAGGGRRRRSSAAMDIVMPHTNVRPILIGAQKRPIRSTAREQTKQPRRLSSVVQPPRPPRGREKTVAEGRWLEPMDFIDFILSNDSLTEEFCYMTR